MDELPAKQARTVGRRATTELQRYRAAFLDGMHRGWPSKPAQNRPPSGLQNKRFQLSRGARPRLDLCGGQASIDHPLVARAGAAALRLDARLVTSPAGSRQ